MKSEATSEAKQTPYDTENILFHGQITRGISRDTFANLFTAIETEPLI